MRLLCVLCASALILPAADYHVTGKIAVGGEGSYWDYLTVDSQARRLYVSHGTHVSVVDLDAGKVIGDIPDTPGVHGIALAPKLGRGFISNGRGNNVTVFELGSLKTLAHIATGQNPDAIVYDPASNGVFTFNGRSHDSTIIDAPSGKVKATVALGGKPEFAVVDGHGKLWVNIEDKHEIAELDTAAASVVKRYDLAGCEEPTGLAFDAGRQRLFSVCANKVMAISDPVAGKVIATLPIGEGADGAAVDPERRLAFSSNGEGTLTVVREAGGRYEVAQTVQTQRGARTIALDPTTHKLYLPAAQFGPPPRPAVVPGSFVVLVVGQ